MGWVSGLAQGVSSLVSCCGQDGYRLSSSNTVTPHKHITHIELVCTSICNLVKIICEAQKKLLLNLFTRFRVGPFVK